MSSRHQSPYGQRNQAHAHAHVQDAQNANLNENWFNNLNPREKQIQDLQMKLSQKPAALTPNHSGSAKADNLSSENPPRNIKISQLLHKGDVFLTPG